MSCTTATQTLPPNHIKSQYPQMEKRWANSVAVRPKLLQEYFNNEQKSGQKWPLWQEFQVQQGHNHTLCLSGPNSYALPSPLRAQLPKITAQMWTNQKKLKHVWMSCVWLHLTKQANVGFQRLYKVPAVIHGGGSVMIWACIVAPEPGQRGVIDGTRKSALY